jgi:hypothetical protein
VRLLPTIMNNNYEFNFSIIINIIYFDSKLVLYIMDTFIFFQTASFLKDILARIAT